MKFADLMKNIPYLKGEGNWSTEIRGISYDSRSVEAGFLFVALKGARLDGHEFVKEAIERGASALVLERELEGLPLDIPYAIVPSSRRALALLSSNFYRHPSRDLTLVGVTGTNGKGLTSHFLYHILRKAGVSTATLGTLGAQLNGTPLPWSERTTPEAPQIQQSLREIVDRGGEVAIMEVSSHALAQDRTWGCEFDIAVFTNLSHDHLDYHRSLEEYFRTKLRLFTLYPSASWKDFVAVINIDDPYGKILAQKITSPYITYGTSEEALVRGYIIQFSPSFLLFSLQTPEGETEVRLPLGGLFNLHNALASASVALALGVKLESIKQGLEEVSPLPGRMEIIDEGQDFTLIIDYAHTPKGLEDILLSLKPVCEGKLITVFGCGGDRDREKRPLMGKIASEISDLVIVTSDNSRSEDPNAIIEDILSGMSSSDKGRVKVEVDRETAINLAISMAEEGDCVVIAGKGHEDYQIFADRVIPFSDREKAREAVRKRWESK